MGFNSKKVERALKKPGIGNNRGFRSVVFDSGQKMALRAFYVVQGPSFVLGQTNQLFSDLR